jgi:hypothetical protein
MIHLPLPDVDLQVAVLVHHEGCEFEVPVDNASGVDEFETLEYLIDEALDVVICQLLRVVNPDQVAVHHLRDVVHIVELWMSISDMMFSWSRWRSSLIPRSKILASRTTLNAFLTFYTATFSPVALS